VYISWQQAVDLLQTAVAKRGADYIYPKELLSVENEIPTECVYYDPAGQPSCMVGEVLYAMGVILDIDDECISHGANGNGLSELIDEDYIHVDTPTLELLQMAQVKQDHGMPWGEALNVALAVIYDHYPELVPAPAPVHDEIKQEITV
jgi:hypothetical protein